MDGGAAGGAGGAGGTPWWGLEQLEQDEDNTNPRPAALPFVACFALLSGLILLTVFAGPASRYAEATAAQLFAPEIYIKAVLGKVTP